MPKLSVEEKTRRKNERKQDIERYQQYLNQPIPPMNFNEKVGVTFVIAFMLTVFTLFAIVIKGDQMLNYKNDHPYVVIVALVLMLVALVGTTVYLKRQGKSRNKR